jgi:hypothetical protein
VEFIDFIPAMVTACIVGPAGLYVKNRVKNLATKHDFNGAIEQLKKSTDAVESIKSQLNEKYWVKQQVWETKRVAYEDILECLHLTKKYLDEQMLYMNDYLYSFIHIGSGCYDYENEEHQESYAQYVKDEQDAFNEKYQSEVAIKASKELSNHTRESFTNLESVFSIKSLYLDPELKGIEALLSKLRSKLYDEKISQDDNEDTGDFLERSVEHHKACGILVNDIIAITRELAIKDLKLID